VHLDAYKIENRLKQLEQIHQTLTRLTFIVGDFNFIDVDDFQPEKSKIELEFHYNFQMKKRDDIKSNIEYNYVTQTLHWRDYVWKDTIRKTPAQMDDMHVPNFSQWTGTRVDHAFVFMPMPPDNKYMWTFHLFYYATTESDHLPLVLDVDVVSKFSVFLNGIPASQSRIVPEDAKTIRKLDMTTEQLLEFIPPRSDNRFYNSQPITAYDWINKDKINYSKYGASDPYMTGNSEGKLGNSGIYTTTSHGDARRFGARIAHDLITKTSFGYEHILLMLFEFQLKPLKKWEVYDVTGVRQIDINYPLEDTKCDIYVTWDNGISKFTPRTVTETGESDFFVPIKKSLMIQWVGHMGMSSDTNLDKYLDILKQVLEHMIKQDPNIMIPREKDHDNIAQALLIFDKAIGYFNNMFTAGLSFDYKNVRIDKTFIFYDLETAPYMTGGSHTLHIHKPVSVPESRSKYYSKYIKYKLKYYHLKNALITQKI